MTVTSEQIPRGEGVSYAKSWGSQQLKHCKIHSTIILKWAATVQHKFSGPSPVFLGSTSRYYSTQSRKPHQYHSANKPHSRSIHLYWPFTFLM